MAKGQTEIVSAVLLMGIMVSLVVVAYFWGVPLIEKQQDVVRVDNMNKFMKILHDNIKSVAKGGGREIMRNVEIPGDLSIDEQGNRIILDFTSSGSVIQPGEQIIVAGDDNRTVAPLGSDPGFITVKSDKVAGKDYAIQMNLAYRELATSTDSYKIQLRIVGRPKIGGSNHLITIEAAESEDLEGKGDGGKTLHSTNVRVRME